MSHFTQTENSKVSDALAAKSAKISADDARDESSRSSPRSSPKVSEPNSSVSSEASKPKSKRQTSPIRNRKASKVEAMLRRKSGATLDQICKATEWQSHTVCAFLSGLRKKGLEIDRQRNRVGKSVYMISRSAKAGKPA